MPENKQQLLWPGWETVKLIGRGSFGEVYEIRRNMFGEEEKAAVKVISIPRNASDIEEMHSNGYDDESITSALENHLKSITSEYSLMRKMNGCSNVVNCDDIRCVQHDDGIGWDVYIKMELLVPLPQSLPDPISDELVTQIAYDICTALELCSKHDILHRDIKPQNIFISPNGDYKLGDFGIAKTMEKTMGGTKIGTYRYMPPEVYHYKPYSGSADLYSLGLVLYWLLNDRRMPFLPLPPEKLTIPMEDAAMERRLAGEQIPAPAHGSSALKRIVLKACAYDPMDRYQSAAEMLTELETLESKHKPLMRPKPEPIPASVTSSEPALPLEPQPVLDPVPDRKNATKPKGWGMALLLAACPYTGLFGVHDFYLGKKKTGILKLCTINFCAFGWIWDIILIAIKKYKTKDGEYLK